MVSEKTSEIFLEWGFFPAIANEIKERITKIRSGDGK